MKRRSLALAAALCIAPACVSQSVHDQLLKDHEQLVQRHNELNAAKAGIDEALAAEQAARASDRTRLEASLAAEKDKVSALDERSEKLSAEMTRLQSEKAELVKGKSKLKASVDEMTVALADMQKRKAQAEQRAAAYQDLLNRFKPLIDSGKLRVRMIDGRMVVQLATDVLFKSASAKLEPAGEQAIRDVSAVLGSLQGRRYEISGHTDNVPMKGARYASNWELAFGRAQSVLLTMIDAGLPPGQVHAASYGEFRPAVANDTPEQRAQNRRIEIVIVPDLSMLPGAEEMERLGSEG